MVTIRRKPMVPNKHKYVFRFKFYISIKAVPKTKLLDGKANRTIRVTVQRSCVSKLMSNLFFCQIKTNLDLNKERLYSRSLLQ